MPQTRILLVRHGETEWNIAGRLQGWQDSPLSARGLAQVHRLAEALIGCAAVALVASDAGRAVATAGVIGDRIGLAPQLDARLREISFGSVEGLTRAALPPALETARAQIMAMDPSCTVALAGGESPATVSARVWSCLDELASRHAGSTVVVVSHGGVLASVLRTVLGIPAGAPRRFRIGNTAVVQVVRRHDAEPWGRSSSTISIRCPPPVPRPDPVLRRQQQDPALPPALAAAARHPRSRHARWPSAASAPRPPAVDPAS